MMLPNGGNPDSAAPASSAANGIPGMIVAVDDPLQFAGSQASAQIPGFQLGGFQPGDGNVALQVMSPSAGLPGCGQQGSPAQQPVRAVQERVRGISQDGTPWEAQRTLHGRMHQ